jgi:hypothetical protein
MNSKNLHICRYTGFWIEFDIVGKTYVQLVLISTGVGVHGDTLTCEQPNRHSRSGDALEVVNSSSESPSLVPPSLTPFSYVVMSRIL